MQKQRSDIYLFDQRDDLEPLVRQKLNENFRRLQTLVGQQTPAEIKQIKQDIEHIEAGSTDDYNELRNKPSIEDVQLIGNKTFPQLGIFIEPEEEYPASDQYALNNLEITEAWNAVMNL